MSPAEHKIIFGCTEENINQICIEDDPHAFKEEEYETTLMWVEQLETVNRGLFREFVSTIGETRGLDELDLIQRCSLLKILLASYIDWGGSQLLRIKTRNGEPEERYLEYVSPDELIQDDIIEPYTIFSSELYTDVPPIRLDFKRLVDQLKEYDPPNTTIETWTNLFSPVLKRPGYIREVTPGIVPGAGDRRKSGRRRKA